MVISSSYPNYKPQDISMTIDVWTEMLKDYSYQDCAAALKIFISSDTSGFAPSIGQLIQKMHIVEEASELNGMEAWALVSRAVRDSAYNAKARFDELPPNVRKAVGSPENLQAWGTDEGYNENVAQSQFIKNYNSVLERKHEFSRLPMEVQALISQTTQKMIGG